MAVTWLSTNDPLATPAQAGCGGAGRNRASARRPFASSTAWPTLAAKAIARTIVPTVKRVWLRISIVSAPGTGVWTDRWRRVRRGLSGESCGRGAAGRRADGSEGQRLPLHAEDEAAVGAGIDERHPADAALGAADRRVAAAGRAGRRAR